MIELQLLACVNVKDAPFLPILEVDIRQAFCLLQNYLRASKKSFTRYH